MSRRLVVAVAVPALVAATYAGQTALRRSGDWVEAQRSDLVLTRDLTGSLKAKDSSYLGPPQVVDLWDYKITRLAPEGVDVQLGTPVLSFDTSELERRLEEKTAEADSARTEIDKRETDLESQRRDDALKLAEAEARARKARLKLDVPPELAKAVELAEARLDLALAEREMDFLHTHIEAAGRTAAAEIRALKDKHDRALGLVEELKDSIARMSVTSPRPGTVIYVAGRRGGEKKKVGDSCWLGETVLEIPDLRSMRAEGEVAEADAGKVARGQRVRLRLDAHSDVEFTGRVASIWKTVEQVAADNPLKVVRVAIDLDRSDPERMRPGMRFRGTVEIGRVAQTLTVPAEAVFPTAQGPVAYRSTLTGRERVALVLGMRNASAVEVRSGLVEGDRVSRRDLGGGQP